MDSPFNTEALVRITATTAQGEFGSGEDHDYLDYNRAKGIYDKLIDGFTDVVAETGRERQLRYIRDVDSADMRASGILKEGQLFTPLRLIDQNIRAEAPSLIQYVTQSRRAIIFASPDSTPVDGKEKLEDDFTTKVRYLKWEIPFVRCIDGAQTHGSDSIEVLFDPDCPANFKLEHIGHDRLIFASDSEELEAQEVIAIKKMLTSNQLRTMAGFNKEQVEKLVTVNQQGIGVQDCVCECYKIYFKQQGIVNVAWYGKACDAYLRAPEPLFLGKRDFTHPMVMEEGATTTDYPPIFEKKFPVYLLKYVESEDPKIKNLVGRAKLDEASQEAASALQSSMVNGSLLAATVMGSPRNVNQAGNGKQPEISNKVIAMGAMWTDPVDFFRPPNPDTSLVQFLNSVVTNNKQEQGSGISFATINRKDSGKTATEIDAAMSVGQELGSVQVILLSIFVREVYNCGWGIYQNRVLQGKIIIKDPFLLSLFGEDPAKMQVDPATGAVIACSGAREYIVKSSGDVDVVQRQEKLNKLMQGWDVFGKTVIAPEYLKDIVRYAFPEDAARYIQIMDTGVANEADALKQLLIKTGGALRAAVTDPATGGLTQQAAPLGQQLAALAQEIMMATGNELHNANPEVTNQLPPQQAAM